jgi:hypothetical protein
MIAFHGGAVLLSIAAAFPRQTSLGPASAGELQDY